MVNGGRWTEDEHARFVQGIKLHGRDWRRIAEEVVKTRSQEQVRIHAQKHHQKQEKLKRESSGKSSVKDGHWTEEEHQLFLRCWAKFGKSWKKISEVMKTRSNEQIRTHAQKYFNKLRELRSRGFDGSYQMDGTRHLTKTFVKKRLPPCSTEGIPVFACPKKSISSWSSTTSSSGSKSVKRSKNQGGRSKKQRRLAHEDYETSDDEDEAEDDDDSQQDWEGDDDDDDDEEEGRDDMDVRGPPRPFSRRLTYTTRSGRIVTANWKEEEECYEVEEEEESERGGATKGSLLDGHHHQHHESKGKALGRHGGIDLSQSSTTIGDHYEVGEALETLETCKMYGRGGKEKQHFFGSEDDHLLGKRDEDGDEEDESHDHQHLDYQYHHHHPYHHHDHGHEEEEEEEEGHLMQMFPDYHHSSFQSVLTEDHMDEHGEHGSHELGHLIFGGGHGDDVLHSSTASSMNGSLASRGMIMASSTITEEDAAERFRAEMDEWVEFTSAALPLEL